MERIFEKLPHKHILGGYHKERGYAYLKEAQGRIKDIKKGIIDEKALLEADYLVHLAGAGIADENWSEERKKEIIESRTKSIDLIVSKLQTLPHRVHLLDIQAATHLLMAFSFRVD